MAKIETIGSVLLVLAFGLLALKGCDTAVHRQAVADYEECLSWQKEGYPIQCNPKNYGLGE